MGLSNKTGQFLNDYKYFTQNIHDLYQDKINKVANCGNIILPGPDLKLRDIADHGHFQQSSRMGLSNEIAKFRNGYNGFNMKYYSTGDSVLGSDQQSFI